MASPYRLFSLVPFNEPDQIWYNLGDRRRPARRLEHGYPYQSHRSHRAHRRPQFCALRQPLLPRFPALPGRGCLPDVISWHELGDFFSGWRDASQITAPASATWDCPPRNLHQRICPHPWRPGQPGKIDPVGGPFRKQQGRWLPGLLDGRRLAQQPGHARQLQPRHRRLVAV